MATFGYEEPVMMPSMGVYNNDLVKAYIAGVKEQYEQGLKEYEDFMKLYLDFYSDVPGATDLYNLMTIGGARDLINNMYAQGIDPFKNPEARAAIRKYIYGVPTGKLNEMKRSAENAAEYKKALAKAMQDPNFDPEYNRRMIGGDLESWDPNKPWEATAPYMAPSMLEFASPYMEKFKQTEILDSDKPGYVKKGTTEGNKALATEAVLNGMLNSQWGRYKIDRAIEAHDNDTDENGIPLSAEEKRARAYDDVRREIREAATQYFQPTYETDPYYKSRYDKNLEVQAHKQKRDYDIAHPLPSSSSRRSGSGSASDPNSESYRPLYASADSASADIIKQNRYTFSGPGTALVANSFKDVQDNIFLNPRKSAVPGWANSSWNSTLTADQALQELTRSDDASRYAAQQGRQSYKGSSSVVRWESGDEDNLYSAQEIAYMAGYRKDKGTEGNNARSKIKKDVKSLAALDQVVTKTDLGKVTIVQIGDRIRVFKPIKVAGTVMYEDTGYYLYDNGEIDEDRSYGALQRDTYSAHKHYSMKQEQTAGELNM